MYFMGMKSAGEQRTAVRRFLGLDRREGAALGSFADMENLCPDGFPALKVRPKRGTVANLTGYAGGMTVKDALIYVDGTHLYVNGLKTALELTEGDKQLVSMGAYLIIWPDKCYLNTADLSDYGSLESEMTTTGSVVLTPTAALDDEEGTFSHTTVQAAGIGREFMAGEGVYIAGGGAVLPEGTYTLLACEEDSIVIALTTAAETTLDTALTLRRYVPDMDYVCECGNRLWGCKYGIVNGEAVNAVYGSALGNFKSWNSFQGLASDSYAASRGSDGVFTAAAAYLGSVLFFKEHSIERLYISGSGAHQVVTLECDGVAKGSYRSLAMSLGVLYYHGVGGVYGFDGSLPQLLSEPLGDVRGSDAVGGAADGVYYLALTAEDGKHLLTLDTKRGLWHRQDSLPVHQFARKGAELYALTDSAVVSLHGLTGAQETADIQWYAETPPIGVEQEGERYLARLEVRLETAIGAEAHAAVSYDGGATWRKCGTVKGKGNLRAATIAVRAVRAPFLKLKLYGRGGCTVHGITAVYEK